MDKKNNNKLIISMTDLEDFADKLIEYGEKNKAETIKFVGTGLKALFIDDKDNLRQEFKNYFEGYVEYRQK
jgi:hypothetical protein